MKKLAIAYLGALLMKNGSLPQFIARQMARYRGINKYLLFAVLLILITSLLVVAYFLNHSQPDVAPDSNAYLGLAYQIQKQGHLVDPYRFPGFPLLIVLVFALAGQNNLMAVSLANAFLFVLSTLEFYLLAALILRRAWAAFLVSLFVGMNVLLLLFARAILSEGMTLWLLVSLTLVAVLFVYTLQTRYLWLASGFSVALFFTRPEWVYVSVPLFAFLLLVAVRQGVGRRMLRDVLICMLLPYAFLGCYMYVDAVQNHFVGVTATQNINAWGKVLDYGMQDEAPPEYANVTQIVHTYMARGITDPQTIVYNDPLLQRNYYELAGAYARAIIIHHPVEFLAKSTQLALSSLTYVWLDHFQINQVGPFGSLLLWLQSLFLVLYGWNLLFPLCAALWIFLLFWQRTAHLRGVQAMGVVVLLALCGLIFTTVGGIEDYMRLHIPFNPLLILVVWSTLLSGVLLVVHAIVHEGPDVIWTKLDHVMNLDGKTGPVIQNRPDARVSEHIETLATERSAVALSNDRGRANHRFAALLLLKKHGKTATRMPGKRP